MSDYSGHVLDYTCRCGNKKTPPQRFCDTCKDKWDNLTLENFREHQLDDLLEEVQPGITVRDQKVQSIIRQYKYEIADKIEKAMNYPPDTIEVYAINFRTTDNTFDPH